MLTFTATYRSIDVANKATLRALGDEEFVAYCQSVKLEELGLLFTSALSRLEAILEHGCDQCERSDEAAITLEEIKKGLEH